MEYFIWEHVVSLMLFISACQAVGHFPREGQALQKTELWLGGICGGCGQEELLRWFPAITKLPRLRGKVSFNMVWIAYSNLFPSNDIQEKNPFTCLICWINAKQNTLHDIYRLGFRQLASLGPPWWITAIDLMSFNAVCKQQMSAQPKPVKPLGNTQVFAVVLSACSNDGQRIFSSPVRGQTRKDLHST